MEVLLTLFVLFLSFQWSRNSRLKIPRVGPPTIFGYVWTALRFTFKPTEVIEEGRARFGGRPFILPSLSGSWILLSGEDIEFVRNADDSTVGVASRPCLLFVTLKFVSSLSQFSQPHAVVEVSLSTVLESLAANFFLTGMSCDSF